MKETQAPESDIILAARTRLSSGRELEGTIGIRADAEEVFYGWDGSLTKQAGEMLDLSEEVPPTGEIWNEIYPYEPVTDAERQELADIMCARWRVWAGRR